MGDNFCVATSYHVAEDAAEPIGEAEPAVEISKPKHPYSSN